MEGTLEIDADIHLMAPSGERLRLVGRGQRMALVMPSLGAGWKLLRSASRARSAAAAGALSNALWRARLALEVVVGPYEVARLGAGAEPTTLARWLGLWPAEVRFGRLLRALLRAEPRP